MEDYFIFQGCQGYYSRVFVEFGIVADMRLRVRLIMSLPN
jgi:hypothetical protein